MSKVKIQGNASGSGVFTLTAPNSSTDRTITLPDGTGTLSFGSSTAEIKAAITLQTTATSNIGLGTGAVDSITTGDYNVGLGTNALTAVTSGSSNTAVGQQSLQATNTGSGNVAVGQ